MPIPKVDEKFYKFQSCDGACGRVCRTRHLNISPDSSVFLCDYCWSHEMEWRRHMNMVHEPAGYGSKGPWPVFTFYQESPEGDDVPFVDDLGDMKLTAEPIYDPDTGKFEAYALMEGGDTVGFAARGAIPEDYVDKVELDELRQKIMFYKRENDRLTELTTSVPFSDPPPLDDLTVANARLVVLWDRVGGGTTFDSFIAWIVYENENPIIYGVSEHKGITELAGNALSFVGNTRSAHQNKEYVVIIMPNISLEDNGAQEYAGRIGRNLIRKNKEAFAERGRTK